MNSSNKSNNRPEFQKILAAIEKFRKVERSTSGVIYTDNWYDSHPRLLIFDPILSPYDKLVWLAIRANCSPDMSLTAFPSYDQIQASLHISRGTVASSISKLRITRWITLLCRDQVRNSRGRIEKDGNIYMVHGEPLSLADTFTLDGNYMGYLHRSTSHRNTDVRRISNLILSSLHQNVVQEKDVLTMEHPFERRTEAWNLVKGKQSSKYFDLDYEHKTLTHYEDVDTPSHQRKKKLTAVHQVDYGQSDSVVHSVNYGAQVYKDTTTRSSSKDKKYNYNLPKSRDTKPNSDELVFHSSLSENQEYLIMLHLQRLPASLPPVPPPWNNWCQLLLDELAGRIDKGNNTKCEAVWNPVSLMAAYCNRLVTNGIGLKDEGKFQVELAEIVLKKRLKKQRSKLTYEQVLRNYRHQIDKKRDK